MAINLGKLISNVGSKLNLPEMGISERFGYAPPKLQAVAPYGFNPTPQQQSQLLAGAGFQPPSTKNITPKQTSISGISGGSYTVPSYITPNTQGLIQNVNQQASDYSGIIDQDYENALSSLSAQEQSLRGQAEIAQSQIGNEYSGALTELGSQQATNVSGVQSELSTAEKEGKSAMQQARDLFRQTQQANIAQLSGLGISSSSVSEALGEKLGIETARRISGITGSLSEIRQNATKELSKINNYFSEKKTQLEQTKANEITKIQQSLMSGINQINTARQQSAIDKARNRLELFTNAQNAISTITQNAQAFEQSLKTWASQKSSAIQPYVTNPEYAKTIQTQTQNINQTYAPSGWEYVPNINASGQITGYTLRKKTTTGTTGTVGSLDYTSPTAWVK